jgi:hypothetical protein
MTSFHTIDSLLFLFLRHLRVKYCMCTVRKKFDSFAGKYKIGQMDPRLT